MKDEQINLKISPEEKALLRKAANRLNSETGKKANVSAAIRTSVEEYANHEPRLSIKGLTLRQHFASIAMQGLLAGHYEYFTGNADVSVPDEIAKYAVLNADALINKLNKQ